MKNIFKFLMFGSFLSLAVFNCSGSSSDDNPDPKVIDPPAAASLSFPNQNSECTEGSNFTSTESDVTFDWSDALNAETYDLVLKNLETQTTSNYSSSSSQLTIKVLRATPYSWFIISKNSGTETAQSPTWKFYNAGEAATAYAPFPAELVNPSMGTSLSSVTMSVSLQWSGTDVDSDIKEYDILFGTVNPPENNQGTVESMSLSVNVTSGNTYYWRVITKDSQNNNSESEIFQFKIN
ncbi:hypothetical protein [Algibacter sp.]|uniref:hypothetical protein n=1 Tax=Algibacter sp. TaxID=1872428 RepID=UPI003C731FF8